MNLQVRNEEAARLQRQQERAATIPLWGSVAAGTPVESVPDQSTLSVFDFIKPKEGTFALRVRGESMIEASIRDGDYVIAEKSSSIRAGDIVVALIGGVESTLKRYYPESNGQIRLQPANSVMEPIFVQSSLLLIQGRVTAVLRHC